MNKIYTLIEMLNEVKDKSLELETMSEAWESDDPETAACSDPSDQYLLGEEISRLWEKIKEIVDEINR